MINHSYRVCLIWLQFSNWLTEQISIKTALIELSKSNPCIVGPERVDGGNSDPDHPGLSGGELLVDPAFLTRIPVHLVFCQPRITAARLLTWHPVNRLLQDVFSFFPLHNSDIRFVLEAAAVLWRSSDKISHFLGFNYPSPGATAVKFC